jgi:AcrR family transcriptional regulator
MEKQMKRVRSGQVKIAQSSPRRREQKMQRQEEILAAAFHVFAAHGYEATRIDEVARQAGIAKGTIYLYFRDKEQLFRAVVHGLVQMKFDAIAGSLQGTAEQLVHELLSRMYSQVVRNEKVRSIVRLLIAESGRFPQLAEIYHREIIAPGMKAIRQVLLRGIASGEFRKTAAVDFPQLLAAPGVLAIAWRLLHGERHQLNLDAYRKAHLEFILNSLRGQADGMPRRG